MKLITGTVVDGKIVVEGQPFEDGTTVSVLADEDEDGFDVTPEQKAELLQAIEQADRGDFADIDADQFLDELDKRL